MSQPLEQGTDYIGGDDREIREEDMWNVCFRWRRWNSFGKEQGRTGQRITGKREVITQAVTVGP